MNKVLQERSQVTTAPLTKLTLSVPELRERPIVGGGCCAIPAESLIEETLTELEQVRELTVSDEAGTVEVIVSEGDQGLSEELKERIEGLGYPVEESIATAS